MRGGLIVIEFNTKKSFLTMEDKVSFKLFYTLFELYASSNF